MYVYKYNEFTKKYYYYDTDYVDIMTEEFDENVHTHDIVLEQSAIDENRKTCCFCNVTFPSRNKLFYHLGYMNIDIRKQSEVCQEHSDDDGYETDMGDFGFFFRRNYRKKKLQKKKKMRKEKTRWFRARTIEFKKSRTQSDFLSAFNNMRLNQA